MQLKRTRIDKLMAMAVQSASPTEALVAQSKLATMGLWPPPSPVDVQLSQPPAEPVEARPFRASVAWGARPGAKPRKSFADELTEKGVRDWDRWAKMLERDRRSGKI